MMEESNEFNKIKQSCNSQTTEMETECAGYTKRRPIWLGSYEAIKYVNSLSRKNFRRGDKFTDFLICILVLIFAMFAFVPLQFIRLPLAVLCDGVIMLTVIYFVMSRLGIITALSERQAILVWDIILGALLLGALIAINIIVALNYIKQMPNML